MVRAMDSTDESLELFTKKSIVAIGWSEVDFTRFTEDQDLRAAIETKYYDEEKRPTNSSMGRKHATMKRFREIKKGDRIIVPYRNQILLAEATGEQRYCAADLKCDLANQQVVEYLKNNKEIRTVLRSELSEGLQRRLRVPGSTVLNLSDFKAEIENLFEKPSQTYKVEYNEKIDKQIEEFKNSLMDRITKGDTYLPAGGKGFEELVAELLKCEGFSQVKILGKNEFEKGTDADIYAIKTDVFLQDEQVYLFQVKHHFGETDESGVKQLVKAKESGKFNVAYSILITTAFLNDAAKTLADNHDIVCMERTAFATWLYDNINKLSIETRKKLGISTVPQLL